ncbi:MAG: DUF305 domain-containing protein [Candidatus Babeliales bacterium]
MRYTNLFFMTILSFISMYVLMYVMVDKFANVYMNLNQLYMAGVMTIPMVLVELVLMRSMYKIKRINFFISVSSLIIFILLLIFIRQQIAISDKEFLKSMIPHHAAAILMCEKASLQDPEIKKLADAIITTQKIEIDLMKKKLKEFAQ